MARTIGFRFHGSGSEYFRIWIVNVLLTVLTLGIYSAWAKVRRQRYFLGNTDLDGSRFDYHGQPMAILKGRVLAVMAYLAFTVSGNISPVLALVMLTLLLMVLTLGLFSPWARVRALRYQLDHLHVQAQGDLAAFTAEAGPATGPFGEAVGDVFDLDLDFGF